MYSPHKSTNFRSITNPIQRYNAPPLQIKFTLVHLKTWVRVSRCKAVIARADCFELAALAYAGNGALHRNSYLSDRQSIKQNYLRHLTQAIFDTALNISSLKILAYLTRS